MELDHLYDIHNHFILNDNTKIKMDSKMLFLKLKR